MEKFLDWFVYHKRQILIIGGIITSILVLTCIVIWKVYFSTNINTNGGANVIVDSSNDIVLDNIDLENDANSEDNVILEDLVAIDIKGAINNPGVYQLSSNSRVKDVLDIAGGVRKDADLSVINLSKKVFDEMVIIIYTKEEVKNFIEVKKQEEEKQEKCVIVEEKIINDACVYENDTVVDTNTSDNKENNNSIKIISLNSASKEELMTLSGIGESKALLIIEYRDTNGGFKNIDELKNIKGIGDSIFEKIKNYISL